MFKELITLPCLWESLKTEPRPIFLYGTGNGADKILDVCIRYDIQIAGVFASSGFVRSRTFRDMPVRSIESIRWVQWMIYFSLLKQVEFPTSKLYSEA